MPFFKSPQFHRRCVFGLLAVAIVQFGLFLNRPDINAAHEARVALTARVMLESGDWWIPHLAGQIRLQKPPLPYWTVAALWTLADGYPVWMARLPEAAMGVMATWLVIDLGQLWMGRRIGLLCGIVWISSFFVVSEFRKAMADPYLAFFTLVAVWAWLKHDWIFNRPLFRRRTSGIPATSGWILLFWVCIGLGILAKGPVILLHVGAALFSYHMVVRRLPKWSAGHGLGIGVAVLLGLAWPVTVALNVENAWSLWIHEIGGQASGARNPAPFYHYMVNLPVIAAPWSILTGVGAVMALQRRHARLRWPLLWLGLTVLIFTVPGQKKNAYLLPEAVAITLLGAAAGDWILQTLRRNLHVRGPQALHRLRLATFTVIVAMILVVNGWVLWIEPARHAHRSPVPFAHDVDVQAHGQEIMAAGFVDEEVLFYLRSPIRFFSGNEISTLADRHGLLILGEESMLREHQLLNHAEILAVGRQGQDSLRFIRMN